VIVPRTHAAIGRHSKGKGAKAELEVGRLLAPWWQKLEPGAQFIRTPGSGGWRHAKGFKARGDLMHDPDTCKLFPFTLEVKRREGWSTGVLFGRSEAIAARHGDGSPIWAWWTQTCKSARDDNRRPMMWFRKNHSPWFVMIEVAVYDCLRLRGMTPPVVRFDTPRHTVVLTHAQTLWIPPRAFVVACTEATET
jgi:hypothetical protein